MKRTFYDILEVFDGASNLEIKKAYRRLALQHHPDRNGSTPEATEIFQQIGEAYHCLSDPTRRRDYDRELARSTRTSSTSSSPGNNTTNTSIPRPPSSIFSNTSSSRRSSPAWSPIFSSDRRRHNAVPNFDAHAQFDNLFRQDPFFQDGFREMDAEFVKRFSNTCTSSQGGADNAASTNRAVQSQKSSSTEGWFPWLLRQCGIELHMTTYTSNGQGNVTATSYSSYGKNRNRSTSRIAPSYMQTSTSSYVDRQGRHVMVQSKEENGNRIEDTRINRRLVQRKVNGLVVDLSDGSGRRRAPGAVTQPWS